MPGTLTRREWALALPVALLSVGHTAAQPRNARRLHPCRAGAHHHHVPRRGDGDELPAVLVAELGVHSAAHLKTASDKVDADVLELDDSELEEVEV